jgi:hypothetical protein
VRVVDRVCHWLLRPWLWYGRWQSERVIDWYLGHVVAECLYWEEMASREAPA